MKWEDVLKQYPEANFLQSPKYAKMHEMIGDKVIMEDFDGKGWALLIVKNAKRGKLIEIPCGPLIDWNKQAVVKFALERIKEIAKKEKCVFVRIRPQLMATEKNIKMLEKNGLKHAPMHLAAEHTVIMDLTKSEDELLAAMRRQTRYDVRRATKLGIVVEKTTSEDLFKEFHKVQLKTAKRQNFIPPDQKTLLAEHEAFGENAVMYIAKTSDGKPIAYGLIIKDGLEGDYYEAASTDLNRKLPGAYALLWQAILDLKAEGYSRFNLWGIAPPGQPNHRYAGVTTFKTGFGGEVVEYIPAHDLIINKFKYLLDWIVEAARRKKRHL